MVEQVRQFERGEPGRWGHETRRRSSRLACSGIFASCYEPVWLDLKCRCSC